MHSRKHGVPSLDSDTQDLVNMLLKQSVFTTFPGRAYRSFPGFTHFTGMTDIARFRKRVKHHQYMAAMERDIILNN